MEYSNQLKERAVNLHWISRVRQASEFLLPVQDPTVYRNLYPGRASLHLEVPGIAPGMHSQGKQAPPYVTVIGAMSLALQKAFGMNSLTYAAMGLMDKEGPAEALFLLNLELEAGISEGDLSEEIREEIRLAYSNQGLASGEIISRFGEKSGLTKDRLFQLGFIYDAQERFDEGAGERYRLCFLMKKKDGVFVLTITYDTACFEPGFIGWLATTISNRLAAAVYGHQEDSPGGMKEAWHFTRSNGQIAAAGETPVSLPATPMESRMLDIWKKILRKDNISTDVSFFKAGGNSLKALRLVSEIYKQFKAAILITDVFEQQTIQRLSSFIAGLGDVSELGKIPLAAHREHYDLSYAQRRMWILSQFEQNFTAYNIIEPYLIRGDLSVPALKAGIQELVRRHEALRTVFSVVNTEPKQQILEGLEAVLEESDVRQYPASERMARAKEIFLQVAGTAFDLAAGPLFKFHLIRVNEQEYLFVLNIHHILVDGWSQGIMRNELLTIYNKFVSGQPYQVPAPNFQYKDYSEWHNKLIDSEHLARQKEYWFNKLGDRPSGVELPIDGVRPAVQTFNGGRIWVPLSVEQNAALKEICDKNGATEFITLMTLVGIILQKYSGQQDILIGSPVAGRKHADLYDVIGFLVNTIVFRFKVEPDLPFNELLKVVRDEALETYRNEDFPFDLLVDLLDLERDRSRSPLFNVNISFNNTQTTDKNITPHGIDVEFIKSGDYNMSKWDLLFFIMDNGQGIELIMEYNSDLFKKTTIERMGANLLTLLDAVTAEPDKPVSQLNCISAGEFKKITETFNDTGHVFKSIPVQELIEARVNSSPDKTAVVSLQGSITYKQLNERANRLAWFLLNEKKVKPNDIVGISADRSIDMIVSILAIIKSGAGYLAFDPGYPPDRIRYMLQDSKVNTVLIDKERPDLYGGDSYDLIRLDDLQQQLDAFPVMDPGVRNGEDDTVYVLYTSGTTGTPNGVMLSHGNLANLIHWQMEKTSIDSQGRVLQFTSTNFCVSFQEIVITLAAGGEIHLIGEIERKDVNYLLKFIGDSNIDVLYLPFSYVNFLFNESGSQTGFANLHLKHIITAGEQLKITTGLEAYFDMHPGTRLHNHFGSSEMHVVTAHTLDRSTLRNYPVPPVGKPISNCKVFILDEFEKVVPIGVFGELYVKGYRPVKGYINNQALTDKKVFPLASLNGEATVYKTGDYGRWLDTGEIEIMGRKDNQFKIRGFRIEIGEIESKIFELKEVKDCVVVVQEDDLQQKMLAAYVVLQGLSLQELKIFLLDQLPQYMVPTLVEMESLPLMPNGKVDRAKLPAATDTSSDEVHTPPGTSLQARLLEIWKDLLKVENIGIDDNFFNLGGHSLKAMKMIERIYSELGIELTLRTIYSLPTIRGISEQLGQGTNEDIYMRALAPIVEGRPCLLFVPPVTGSPTVFIGMAKQLSAHFNIYGFQYKGFEGESAFDNSIEDMALRFFSKIETALANKRLCLVGYSMGAAIAFELAKKLENKDREVNLVLIDRNVGAPDGMPDQKERLINDLEVMLDKAGLDARSSGRIRKFVLHNVDVLDRHVVDGVVQADITAIEAGGNIVKTRMEDWEAHTSGHFEHFFVEESHFDILNRTEELNELIIRSFFKTT
jgi:amino acid adenylation domain-containing protein